MDQNETGYIPSPAAAAGPTWATAVVGKYCVGHHVDITTLDADIKQLFLKHQCVHKCKDSPTDPDCSGHFAGYDTPEIMSLCLALEVAQELFPWAASFDNHKNIEINRVFINMGACTDADFGDDASYELKKN